MKFTVEFNLDKDFVKELRVLKELYGEEFELLNGLHNSNLNHTDFISNFIDKKTVADATIDSNANARSKDITSMVVEKGKPSDKLLAFNKIFYEIKKKSGLERAIKWLHKEWTGEIYLHDASSSSYSAYCFAYDLESLATCGLFFIDAGRAEPAQHLSTWCDHTLEFVSWVSNRSSGACGLPSFLVYSFYFWQKDVKSKHYMFSPEWYRDQFFQKVIFDLNQPYLRITQSAFTNFSIFDRNYLIELFGGRQYPDGSFVIDFIDDIIEFQKSFMRIASKIKQEKMYTFPVLTYSLLFQNGEFVDQEFSRWCSDHNIVWNDSNFFTNDNVNSLSNCCRLLSDTKQLNPFINSIGGTALSIGSIKVNTINLRRISLISHQDKDLFFKNLDETVDICVDTLDTIRHILKRNVEKGLLPIYQDGLMDFDKQYSTIGVTAVEEVMKDFGYIQIDEFGYHSYSEEGLLFTEEIFNFINKKKDSYNKNYKFNIECVPAERANVILAKKDKMLFPNAVPYNIYSNQWIALTDKTTIEEKIRLGSKLDKLCGGGTIAHINLEAPLQDKEVAWKLLNKIASGGVFYFAFNTRISSCINGHGFFGETCPICQEKVIDTWQRIVGYIVPTSGYGRERKIEFLERYWMTVE